MVGLLSWPPRRRARRGVHAARRKADSSERGGSAEFGPLGTDAGHHPDLQRGGEHQADRRAGAGRGARGRTSWSPTTTAPTAPASSPTSWPPRTTRSTSCTARARKASAPPTSPASAGASTTATACWSRWTPTARTSPRNCPGCSTALKGADLVARLPLGARRPGGQLAQVPRVPLPRRQHLLPADARRADPRRHRRLPRLPRGDPGGPGLDDVASPGLLLPGRPGPGARSRPASTSSRCRSPSSSASAATAR